MAALQELIYRLEEGGGKRWLRVAAASLGLSLIVISYNWICFRNLGTQEAMDYAQLGRNLAEGKGFTTLFIRPLSIRLLWNRAADNPSLAGPWDSVEPARLKGEHPDIANAPVYPLVLAGLMKILPFDFQVDLTRRFWSVATSRPVEDWEQTPQYRMFRRYQPDFIISAFNQVVFLVVVFLSFVLARSLFNLNVAVLSTVLLLGTDQLWRFCVSGLPTMLLLFIFMCLLWCLVRLERGTREGEPESTASEDSSAKPRLQVGSRFARQDSHLILTAASAGALVALGGLTRYPFAWLILPVVIFVVCVAPGKRLVVGVATTLAFILILTPWVVRNYLISGAPFGTASYAILEGNSLFPGSLLERSLDADFSWSGLAFLKLSWFKLVHNSRQIIQSDLPRLGGTWLCSFFLIGLLVPVAQRRARRLGYFLALSLVVLAIAQALARTQLSEDSEDINSENLLVLFVPAIWIYGVSLFYHLLGQVVLPHKQLRQGIMVVFCAVTCLPMILSILAGRASPVVFPPYYPPSIRFATGFVHREELMMSDIPWAVAWYGRAQCIWLTQNKQDFFVINDRHKAIQALYLTHASGAGRYESFDQWVRAGEENWGDFIVSCVIRQKQGQPGPPADFPLEFWQKGWPMHFLLTRREKPLINVNSR